MFSRVSRKQENGERKISSREPLADINHINILNVSLDNNNFEVRINGEIVNYQKLTLTKQGLEINDVNEEKLSDEQNIKIMVDLSASIEFDTKLNENKYCVQLAKSIQRCSNGAYIRYQKNERLNKSKQVSHHSSRLQLCEYMVRKIPLKSRCIQNVLRNIATQKIQFLFEIDSFFMELVSFIFKLVLKINLSQLIGPQKNVTNKNELLLAINESEDEKFNEDSAHNLQRTWKKKNSRVMLTQLEQKALKLYKATEKKIQKYKYCYQRINLLISLFTRQTRLSTYLYQLNKSVISLNLAKDLKNILLINQVSKTDEFPSTKPICNIVETLQNLMKIIKTVNLSLGKSEFSFKVLKQQLLENLLFENWIKTYLPKISQSSHLSYKFVEMIALICQFGNAFVSTIYSSYQTTFNMILKSQIQWAYETLYSQYPSEKVKRQKQENANTILDALFFIMQSSIKSNLSSVNIGRSICKYICNTAIQLREKDIKQLTEACCANQHSRQMLLKFLFNYFRKFIRSIKNSLKGPWNTRVPNARKAKLKLLEIMQSIRKISQIDSIDFAIDEELVNDIRLILQTAKCRKTSNTQRNDCAESVYLSMIKNVPVQPTKQKQTQDTEGIEDKE